MKHLLLIITLFTSLCAAAIEPIVSESKEWYHAVDKYIRDKLQDHTDYEPMIFEGTTLIDGIVYHNLVNTSNPENVLAHIRQEGAKTFIRLDDCPYLNPYYFLNRSDELQKILDDYEEVVLFDFDAKPGDKYLGYACDLNKNWSIDTVSVIDVEEIELNGKSLTKQTLSFPVVGGWHNLEVIEGIGCIDGCFFAPFTTAADNGIFSIETLVTCVKDRSTGEVLYSYDSVGISNIEADGRYDDRMYDLMGREIRNPLPGTVYIQRGRKFVSR